MSLKLVKKICKHKKQIKKNGQDYCLNCKCFLVEPAPPMTYKEMMKKGWIDVTKEVLGGASIIYDKDGNVFVR